MAELAHAARRSTEGALPVVANVPRPWRKAQIFAWRGAEEAQRDASSSEVYAASFDGGGGSGVVRWTVAWTFFLARRLRCAPVRAVQPVWPRWSPRGRSDARGNVWRKTNSGIDVHFGPINRRARHTSQTKMRGGADPSITRRARRIARAARRRPAIIDRARRHLLKKKPGELATSRVAARFMASVSSASDAVIPRRRPRRRLASGPAAAPAVGADEVRVQIFWVQRNIVAGPSADQQVGVHLSRLRRRSAS